MKININVMNNNNLDPRYLEKYANKCLHCGDYPKCYHTDYFGDYHVGNLYMFECECGIQTNWLKSEDLLQVWNSVSK